MTVGLEVRDLETGYGELRVVRGLSLSCNVGEITALLGRNGAGKTTTLSAIAGLLPTNAGTVAIHGEVQTGPPARRVANGLSMVQEGKRVFRARTVEENLRLGGFVHRGRSGFLDAGIERSYERFPILKEKRNQAAGMLSGGQQQMLAIAQALMADPKVLMLDEPSAGLAPSIVEEVFNEITSLKTEGLCVLLVEQLIDNSLAIADRVAVLDHGRITIDTEVKALTSWDVLRESYLGTTSETETNE
ncbi:MULTISPECIES: ABC transporter ATP-binding protein [Microbacterium]|uniref:Amino acid/amide ABC transporter ATP-binding protein 2, HAAT family n=1 Tax=Microbacterium saccharophilum TaxID=1213358 RepID=A0A7Z7D0Q1_9MICO|nr:MULTISPECIES: ABC transporter ATP-binding protein [Microbacterium]SFI61111.1 amino acid/amide ABC transporter ATP-binding protein 2, HAAT family [Microbacterium saccharophilum]